MEYQRRFKKAFDKTITPTHFQQGDLVLRKIEMTERELASWMLCGNDHIKLYDPTIMDHIN
jgi:hypothetical protein